MLGEQLIPAGAGHITGSWEGSTLVSAHPRWRGAHAITSVNSQFDEFLTRAIRSLFKVSSIASLLNDAYTVIGNLPGGGVECRQIRRWSRPWGLSRND